MTRKFTQEYKHEAVKLVVQQGLVARKVAEDLGIGRSTLEKWVRDYRKEQGSEERMNESEQDELKRLRKEVKTLRMERDILKKATAFFAKDS